MLQIIALPYSTLHGSAAIYRWQAMLYGNIRLDVGVRVVVFQGKVLKPEFEDVLYLRIEYHARKGTGRSRKLKPRLLQMVEIQMGIAGGMDEFPRLQLAYLRHHHQQQGVGCDVERDTQERIGGALVELQRQPPVSDVELEEAVARWQCHFFDFCGVPCRDHHPPTVGMVADKVYDLCYLVNGLAVFRGPRTPLMAVDRAKVAGVWVSPFIPYTYTMVLKVTDIGVAGKKPKEFVNNALQMEFLCGEERKAIGKVETHLVAEDAAGSRSRTVCFLNAVTEYVVKEFEILFHGMDVCCAKSQFFCIRHYKPIRKRRH